MQEESAYSVMTDQESSNLRGYELLKREKATLLPTITLAIEHKEREFLPKVFLAAHLMSKGFRVLIGSTEAIHLLAMEGLDRSIIFHKSTLNNFSGQYKSLGHKFVFLDEEGGPTISRSRKEHFCNIRYQGLSPRLQDIALLPDLRTKQIVTGFPQAAGVKLYATGWPRIDLWQPQWSYLIDEEAEKLRSIHGEFVLFVSSFGKATRKNFHDPRLKSKWQIDRRIALERKKALHEYINLLTDLQPVLSELGVKVVIRPHNIEKTSDWERLLKGVPNIVISKDGDIAPWVKASRIILQWGSVTSLQAALQGKRSIQYKVGEIEGITDSPSFELCDDTNTPTEVLEVLTSAQTKEDEMMEKASSYLDLGQENIGATAAETISSLMWEERLPAISPPKISAALSFRLNSIYFGSHIHRFLGKALLRSQDMTVAEKIPGGVTVQEISEFLRKLAPDFPEIINFSGRQLGPNVVEIWNGQKIGKSIVNA